MNNNFKLNDVVELTIDYGDYSNVRKGIVKKKKAGKYLVEYIFWGPYDEDPEKYQQWCTDSELTLITDENVINEVHNEHETFVGHTVYTNTVF